jgi:hypothetical protein
MVVNRIVVREEPKQGNIDRDIISKLPTYGTAIVGIVVLASTLYGVYRFYSPIIYLDEWDGYVGFYAKSSNFASWWEQHNEHRILTSRVLFWLDLSYFHGDHVILFVAQLAMIGGIVAIIWFANRRNNKNASSLWVLGVACAFLFSWSQHEALTWGFETQVAAANFFAVWSIAEFSRFDNPVRRRIVAGFVLAALSEFSMGNGLGAPLALVAISVLGRRPPLESIAASIIALALFSVYFVNYTWINVPCPVVSGNKALLFTQFFSIFLGNPLFFAGRTLTQQGVVGAFTCLSGVGIIVYLYIAKQMTQYRSFLIGVYLFVIATALAATGGRFKCGLDWAHSSRNTAGPLLGWCVLLLLLADAFSHVTWRRIVLAVSLALAVLLLPSQRSVGDDNAFLYDGKLGLLGYNIGLEHTEYTRLLFPLELHSRFEQKVHEASEHKLGVYSQQWLIDAGTLKYNPGLRNDALCRGHLNTVTEDSVGMRLAGWATGGSDRDGTLIVIVDSAGNTVGYGVTGQARPDVVRAIPGAPADAGWVAFAKRVEGPLMAYAYVEGAFCKIESSPGA